MVYHIFQSQLRELKPLFMIKRKINFLSIVFITVAFVGCSKVCENTVAFHSTNFRCTIVKYTPEIKELLFLNSEITNLEMVTVIVDNVELIQGTIISLYSANSLLCRYKIIEVSASYSIIETCYPLDKRLSWKFPQHRYKLVNCLETVTFNKNNNDQALILSLQIMK
jgi:hypothetical protein